MSDSYADWCNSREEQWERERQQKRQKYLPQVEKFASECLKSRKKAKLQFVKCCATCAQNDDSGCYKLGLSYVDDMCVCKFWQPKAKMCDDDIADMKSMLLEQFT